MTWLEEHERNTIEHLLWLREIDAEYARYALKAYKQMQHCPVPDIEQKVIEAWKLKTQKPK